MRLIKKIRTVKKVKDNETKAIESEYDKAYYDFVVYGEGYLEITENGSVRHVPLDKIKREAVNG